MVQKAKPSVKVKVAASVGEPVYSPTDLWHLFCDYGLRGYGEARIRDCASGLAVTPNQLGIEAPTARQGIASYIKRSDLGALIDRLGIVSVTSEQLGQAADMKYGR